MLKRPDRGRVTTSSTSTSSAADSIDLEGDQVIAAESMERNKIHQHLNWMVPHLVFHLRFFLGNSFITVCLTIHRFPLVQLPKMARQRRSDE